MTTQDQPSLMDLVDAYAEARHTQGHSTYNTKTAEARQRVVDAIALRDAQEAAIGAGGVSPLLRSQCLQQIEEPSPSPSLLWAAADPSCGLDRVQASSPIGEFVVDWKGWKLYPAYDLWLDGDHLGSFLSLDDAKGRAAEYLAGLAQKLHAWLPTHHTLSQWISVKERLPEPNMAVLLHIGGKIPIRAIWVAKHTLAAAVDFDPELADYDEATDEYYCHEGWYEWNCFEECHWRVDVEPIAWAPLPLPPSTPGVSDG